MAKIDQTEKLKNCNGDKAVKGNQRQKSLKCKKIHSNRTLNTRYNN